MMSNFLAEIGTWAFLVFFIGFCIFIHEAGHFLAARWRKLHVDAFSIGFRKIWSKKINGVEYRIGCIPIGGYVEVPQVDASDAEPKAADGTVLPRATALDRIIVAFAGPFFNVLFGLLLGCAVWIFGMPQDSPKLREIEVAEVDPAGPEYQAGLRAGDRIIRVNGGRFEATWMKFIEKYYLFGLGEIRFEAAEPGTGKVKQIVFTPREGNKGKIKDEKIAYPYFTPHIPIELLPKRGGIAEKAGIRHGDILISIDGERLADFQAFHQALDISGGRELTFKVMRGGKVMEFRLRPKKIALGPEYSRRLVGISMGRGGSGGVAVTGVMRNLPAEKAGIMTGDIILSANGVKVSAPAEVQKMVIASGDRDVVLRLRRGDAEFETALRSIMVFPHTIGVELLSRSYPTPLAQFFSTCEMTWKSLRGMFVNLGNTLGLTSSRSTIKLRHMSGIVGMGDMLYKSVRHVSVMTGIYFVGVISFALAIFNLLPIPVLDGGHIMFAVLEIIFRRRVPDRLVKVLSAVFMILLIALMVFATYNDVRRLTGNFSFVQKNRGGK